MSETPKFENGKPLKVICKCPQEGEWIDNIKEENKQCKDKTIPIFLNPLAMEALKTLNKHGYSMEDIEAAYMAIDIEEKELNNSKIYFAIRTTKPTIKNHENSVMVSFQDGYVWKPFKNLSVGLFTALFDSPELAEKEAWRSMADFEAQDFNIKIKMYEPNTKKII